MKLEIFTLCDEAHEANGKLYINGAFQNLSAPGFPCLHPRFCVVARIRFVPIEIGEHSIQVIFKNEDGKDVLPIPVIEQKFTVQIPDGKQSATLHSIILINAIQLTAPGEYMVGLAVDRLAQAELPLYVSQMPMTPQLPEPPPPPVHDGPH